jgi:hypothetical protein
VQNDSNSSQDQEKASKLKDLLLKLENYKTDILQKNNFNNNCQSNQLLFKQLSSITNRITDLPDSNDLKAYKLTEEISVTYFQLRLNLSLDKRLITSLFDNFKTEITNSDHYLYQVSQNMVECTT